MNIDDSNMILNSKLTNRGYIVNKNDLTFKQIQKIKKDLIVRPFVMKDYPQANPYTIYLESTKKFYLPRYYGIELFGSPKIIDINEGDNINIKFTGALRPVQIIAKEAYINSLTNNYGGGVLCLPCGFGKSVLALDIISELKKKTLIVVHKEFLANQWIDRINQYLPNTRVGKIQGKVLDINDKDICVGMLQTLSLKEFDKDIFKSFGLIIFDEVHHLASEVFSRTLLKVNFKYTMGLSATPDRADGLTRVFLYYLGNIVYRHIKDKKNSFNLIVKHIKYISDDENYNKVELSSMGKICSPRMINNVVQYNNRLELIVNILHNLALDKDKNIILLSDRRDHLKQIYNLLNKDIKVDYYIGGMKQNLLDKTALEAQIILSTYCMCSEALDIQKLNCLVLASPKVNVEQAVGRILRQKHNINPLVIDIEDDFSIFKNQYKKRLKYYKSNNYIIDNVEIDVNNNENDNNILLNNFLQTN